MILSFWCNSWLAQYFSRTFTVCVQIITLSQWKEAHYPTCTFSTWICWVGMLAYSQECSSLALSSPGWASSWPGAGVWNVLIWHSFRLHKLATPNCANLSLVQIAPFECNLIQTGPLCCWNLIVMCKSDTTSSCTSWLLQIAQIVDSRLHKLTTCSKFHQIECNLIKSRPLAGWSAWVSMIESGWAGFHHVRQILLPLFRRILAPYYFVVWVTGPPYPCSIFIFLFLYFLIFVACLCWFVLMAAM